MGSAFIYCDMEIVYDDNHIIIVNKSAGELVQGDRTGDPTLIDMVKDWIKEKYNKPGNVFLGVTHRIDRPTCGLVVMAKTSKGLSRMNELFRKGEVHKTYWALTCARPEPAQGELRHFLVRNERACRQMPPSGLERGAPYFRSPLMGQPMVESWQRIWWWRPVSSSTSTR